MLALDSDRWSDLRTAYGSGVAAAQWLAQLTSQPELVRKHWEGFDYYGHLCHQETVYTASYAVVPHLVKLVRQLPSEERHTLGMGVLYFIGSVAGYASRDGIWRADYNPQRFQAAPIPDDLRSDFKSALVEADELIVESIEQTDNEDRVTALFTSLSAVRGYTKLWEYLSMINIERDCPQCGAFVPPM